MFNKQTPEMNPTTLIRVELPHSDFRYDSKQLTGLYYRVIPDSARDVFYMQTIQSFIPESGDGLLVRADLMPTYYRRD